MPAITEQIKEWWTKALLGQQRSAHPVFGENVEVDVDGDVVTLSGTVESAEQIEEIEREVRGIVTDEVIVNHLTIAESGEIHRLQTVIGVFPTRESAKLACQTVSNWKLHANDEPPVVLTTAKRAREYLECRLKRARVPKDGLKRYVNAVKDGKALLVDYVPEDDALQVISALEGSDADAVYTLPPEPGSQETGSA